MSEKIPNQKKGGVYQHVASRCTRCEGYASIAFGDAQVDLAFAEIEKGSSLRERERADKTSAAA